MEPTIGAELAAVRRSLSAWLDAEGLPPLATADLREAVRALERIEKTWARVLPHLVADNAALAAMLRDAAGAAPAAIRDAAAGASAPEFDPGLLDASAADARNRDLRDLLAQVIAALPSEAEGAAVRERLAAGLDRSLETRPW